MTVVIATSYCHLHTKRRALAYCKGDLCSSLELHGGQGRPGLGTPLDRTCTIKHSYIVALLVALCCRLFGLSTQGNNGLLLKRCLA